LTLVKDTWAALRRYTPARVGLGRTGVSLPTVRHLEIQEALALARDAVREEFAPEAIAGELRALGLDSLECRSAATDRSTYLRRPDLGRRLLEESRSVLKAARDESPDVALVVADGLSAAASRRYAPAFAAALRDLLPIAHWKFGPVALVHQGRVAVGDEIGELLGAQAVLVLIGERPGLSASDSLGAYITWAPRVGRHDAERNCISNIRTGGLSVADGARSVAALLASARKHQFTGVALSQLLAAGSEALPHAGEQASALADARLPRRR
jgi:ethanolamine ammonia-lyase small subunit